MTVKIWFVSRLGKDPRFVRAVTVGQAKAHAYGTVGARAAQGRLARPDEIADDTPIEDVVSKPVLAHTIE